MGKMHGIAKFDHVPQKIRSMTEALQDARHQLPPGLCAPLAVDLGHISSRIRIFDQLIPGVYHGMK
jgi:hypothetical protein